MFLTTVNVAAVLDFEHWFGFPQIRCFGKPGSAAVARIEGENVLIPGPIYLFISNIFYKSMKG
jgi:hypothetical protein